MEYIKDPYLVLDLPLYQLDGASFMSKDAYGHLCTVADTLWRPSGLYFDGADSIGTIPAATSLANIFDGGGTIEIWIKPDSDGEASMGRTISGGAGWDSYIGEESAGKTRLTFASGFTTTAGRWDTTAREITIGAWNYIAITYDNGDVANDSIIYVDGSSVGITEIGTPDGTRVDDSAIDILIGNVVAKDRTFDGIIGEARLYNRILTLPEIRHNYLSTKWRYR